MRDYKELIIFATWCENIRYVLERKGKFPKVGISNPIPKQQISLCLKWLPYDIFIPKDKKVVGIG